MKKKGNEVLLAAITGKVLAMVAREAVPFVLSLLVRSGIKRYLQDKKEANLPEKAD